ncbi:MAG: HD domain-containing protein [Solirubrobacterales bacterium]|nr:HD domain-containing protein [Solirubrobacterales bacterium]
MIDAREQVRRALGQRRAWLVGGAVRDRALGREGAVDLDVVVEGDAREAAAALAGALRRAGERPARFALSEEFGAWRVVARRGGWHVDIEPLHGEGLAQDLARRDFTVNAIAEPLEGGEPIDPLGGLRDLEAGRLRLASGRALREDPLRVLRLARMTIELGLRAERDAVRAAQASAPDLEGVSAERIFQELRRIVEARGAIDGIELLAQLGALAVVLPELEATRGVEQNRFHHLDVYGHTLEVLSRVIALQEGRDSEGWLASLDGRARAAIDSLLHEPLGDELTRGGALRWGALLHDAAKPRTREVRPADGRVTFIGHDAIGAELARARLGSLRAGERVRAHVAALVRYHLRLGFLVHKPQPLGRRALFAYMRGCEPVAADVTLLSVADRLATRGASARRAIDAHLAVARQVVGEALRWREQGPPAPLLRGDELAAELGRPAGPWLGALLERLAEAQYAGEIATREQALARARALEASQQQ